MAFNPNPLSVNQVASSAISQLASMATVGRTLAAPLLFLNLIMYFIVLGFASWCLNRFINGQTYHPKEVGLGFALGPIHLLLPTFVLSNRKLSGCNAAIWHESDLKTTDGVSVRGQWCSDGCKRTGRSRSWVHEVVSGSTRSGLQPTTFYKELINEIQLRPADFDKTKSLSLLGRKTVTCLS